MQGCTHYFLQRAFAFRCRPIIYPLAILLLALRSVHAQTDDQREASVCIEVCRGPGCYLGSGVYIEPGVILTAAHVARGVDAETKEIFDTPADKLEVRTIYGRYKAVEKFLDAKNDIAIIKADLPEGHKRLKMASIGPKPGDVITLLRRGGMSVFKSKCAVRQGTFKGVAESGYAFYDCVVQHGDSGSPLLNEAGEVIGIVSFGLGPIEEWDVECEMVDGTKVKGCKTLGGASYESIRSLVAEVAK